MLALLVIGIPIGVVQLLPTDAPEPFVFEATVDAKVGQSVNDQLWYFDTHAVRGSYPGSDTVVAIDRSYTRGASPEEIVQGSTYWFQGGLMTPDVFYGEQYLFFGKPEVYVRQVKNGLLWPDQITELRVLYLSPLTTLATPVAIPFLVRSDPLSASVWAVLLARLALVVVLVVLVVHGARKKQGLLLPLLGYATLAMALSVPILGDLY
jgi:hypothetical protein